jgi:hypothetical protein
MTQSNSQTQATSYFNLHTQGIGYLNRVREVTVRRGQPFMACDIAALHGAADDVEYTRFDCKVAGGEADRLIRQYMADVQAERKVLLGFRIGDLWTDAFIYEKGERQGQPGASLRGRLIFIDWIKIDGAVVYKAPARTPTAADHTPTQADQPAADTDDHPAEPQARQTA